MVFSSFVKLFHHSEKISFFQSAYPYLKSNNLTKFHTFFNTSWRSKYPHASAASSSERFLGIDAGHYGLYYSIFNRDVDRRRSRRNSVHVPLTSNIMKELLDNSYDIDKSSRFFILRIKKDLHIDIDGLKALSKQYLSALTSGGITVQARYLSTHSPLAIELSQPQEDQAEKLKDPTHSLHTNLINQIVTAFTTHTSPLDLNIIYPLYQSLKRNDLTLLSIEEYNMVLKSIADRSLNSEITASAIESKLTVLLTVYQDILEASKHEHLKPNDETFCIVLGQLFRGSNDTWDLSRSLTPYTRVASLQHSKEYAKLGLDLFQSIKSKSSDNFSVIIPELVRVLVNHKDQVAKALFDDIMALAPNHKSGEFFVDLINLLRYTADSVESKLTGINALYEAFKAQAVNDASLEAYEYELYSAVIATCAETGNLPVATKFLDTILLDYKAMKGAHGKSSGVHVPSKAQLSAVMSSYVSALLNIGQVDKAHNLINTFNQIDYLPELTVQVLNDAVNALLGRLNTMQDVDAVRSHYDSVWKLYVRLAIRKDYHLQTISQPCRESLMVTGIKLGDHDRVFQLIKELLLKNHMIKDINVLRMCCSYLYSGYETNRDQRYYLDLLWTLVDGQAEYYNDDNLNTLLSELVPCIIHDGHRHTLELVLNSLTIRNAFYTFDLQNDNVYGIYKVSQLLFSFLESTTLHDTEKVKVLNMLCLVSNQFHDAENHYIELQPELVEFKQQLASQITALMNECEAKEGFQLSSVMSEACVSLDIPVNSALMTTSSGPIDFSAYDIDISSYLNVNYKVGVTRFLDSFRRGFGFNYRTWNILINQSFVHEVLERKKSITTQSFIQRILSLQLSLGAKTSLLIRLVSLNSDTVNIAALKELATTSLTGEHPLNQTEFLTTLMSALMQSPNVYARKLSVELFPSLYKINSDYLWVGRYMSMLVKFRSYEGVEQSFKSVPSILDLESLSKINNVELITAIIRFFNFKRDYESCQTLVNSLTNLEIKNHPLVREQIMNFHLTFDKVDGSTEVSDSDFLAFYKSLSSHNESGALSSGPQLSSIVTAILSQPNFKQSLQIALENANVIVRSKKLFVDQALTQLVRAGVINHDTDSSQDSLIKRFEMFLRCLRGLNIRSLTESHLESMLMFLTITKSRETLNFLLQRLFNGDQMADLVRLGLLEFVISESAKKPLVELLSSSAAFVDDPSMSLTINTYKQQSNIRATATMDFETNLRGMLA